MKMVASLTISIGLALLGAASAQQPAAPPAKVSPVKTPKLDAEGMSLVGGRLLPGDPGPVAQFMYQNAQGRRATLYVRTEGPDQRETAFRYAREGNVRVFYWIDRKFGYALSSADMEREELLRLANLVYRQLNP